LEHRILLNSLNKTAYSRADVVEYFCEFEGLFDAERVLLTKLTPTIKGSKILDLGVGGGRTTRHLLQISEDYTGVDYVPQFAKETAEKFPKAKIFCGDARDLNELADNTFDFVLFSFNGLDCISNYDRQFALKEILRVLKPNGTFMFSSHNRDYKHFDKLPWQRKIEYSASFLKFCVFALAYLPRHYKMKRYEVFNSDYALVNDIDHRFSLLLYYISIDKQREQLATLGFSDIEPYDHNGELVEFDTESHWIYYLAKKK